MSKDLMFFEGQHEVLILLKDDVGFNFSGDFIIRAKDVASVLEYQGSSATQEVLKFVKPEHVFLVKNSDMANLHIRKLNNAGETFISNLALNRVLGKSEKPKAEPFQDWLYEEVLPSVQKHGGYIAHQPQSKTEALLQAVQIMAEQERQLKELAAASEQTSQKVEVLGHRMDNFDSLDTVGDPQQRLSKMIKRFAHQEGCSYQKAWNEFVMAYNTAHRTNLKLRRENYRKSKGLKKLTTPEYLFEVGIIEDGIRVADKLLNRKL